VVVTVDVVVVEVEVVEVVDEVLIAPPVPKSEKILNAACVSSLSREAASDEELGASH